MPAVAKGGEGGIEDKLANNEEKISSHSWRITQMTGTEDLYISAQTQLPYLCAQSRKYSLLVWWVSFVCTERFKSIEGAPNVRTLWHLEVISTGPFSRLGSGIGEDGIYSFTYECWLLSPTHCSWPLRTPANLRPKSNMFPLKFSVPDYYYYPRLNVSLPLQLEF